MVYRMNNQNNGIFNQNVLDTMAIISFLVGIANYHENISQSDVQDLLQNALRDLHSHLEKQDEKIDEILTILKKCGVPDYEQV